MEKGPGPSGNSLHESRPRVLRPPPITPASRAPSRPRCGLSRRSNPPEDTVDVVLQGRRHAAGPGGSGNLRGVGNKETKTPSGRNTSRFAPAGERKYRETLRPQQRRISKGKEPVKQEAGRCWLVVMRSVFPLCFRVAIGRGDKGGAGRSMELSLKVGWTGTLGL